MEQAFLKRAVELTKEIQEQIAESERLKSLSAEAESNKKITIDEIESLKKELTRIRKEAINGKNPDPTVKDVEEALKILKGK